ncbi:MAG: MBL fold metallo-hydrolase [Candidatus Paceibacterota bacterium]
MKGEKQNNKEHSVEAFKNTITFYGGAGTVTGSNFLLTLGEVRILIDCGLTQGEQYCDSCNYDPFPYDASQIDFLFATHAHADHIGLIPKLVREGFRGTIYSTPATRDLSEVMFADSVRIITREAQNKGIDPLYTDADIQKAQSLWKTLEYHQETTLKEGVTVNLKDAGHILGSAMVVCMYKGKKVVFTGDLGNSPSPLLKDTEYITDADYMVIESVYGDRNHEGKKRRVQKLQEAIEDITARGGTLMIPSFSIQRTQVLLYLINNFIEDNVLAKVPVFLDSPLAITVTGVFRKYTHLLNDGIQKEIRGGDDIFNFPQFSNTKEVSESKAILKHPGPKIIIAGSGMSSGGRILHHEKQYLSSPKNMLLFIGYQAVGTLGRLIQDGAKEVLINNAAISIKAEIRTINGFSAHKDSDNLIEFVEHSQKTLKKVFVAMGEPKSSLFLVQRLRDYLEVDAVSPEKGEVVMLDI